MRRFLTVVGFIAFPALAILGQGVPFLVPVTPQGVFGGYGSYWQTELVISNTNPEPVKVLGYFDSSSCNVMCSNEPEPIIPRGTLYLPRLQVGLMNCGVPGRVLWADTEFAAGLSMTLRTRDTSRDDRAWGAIVPVVTREGLFGRPFSIVDVPLTEGFRSTLRVYDVDPMSQPLARVRYFALNSNSVLPEGSTDELLAEHDLEFVLPPPNTSPFCAAYVEIPLSTQADGYSGRVRVEIVPVDGLQEYWGFVSVTNNDSQEVSIITPN